MLLYPSYATFATRGRHLFVVVLRFLRYIEFFFSFSFHFFLDPPFFDFIKRKSNLGYGYL